MGLGTEERGREGPVLPAGSGPYCVPATEAKFATQLGRVNLELRGLSSPRHLVAGPRL